MAFARDRMRLRDFLRGPFRGAPVEHLALVNQVAHGAHRLLDRRIRISPMTKIEIEVIDLQPAHGVVARREDMLAAQAFLVGNIPAPENLARNQEGLVRPAHLPQDVAHDRFGTARRVGLRIIEKINALVVSGLHQIGGDLVADLLTERDP